MMKLSWTLLIVFLLFGSVLHAVEPMVDLMPDCSMTSGQPAIGKWHRTAFDARTATVAQTVDPEKHTFDIARRGAAGYSAWRVILELEPGEYTLETTLDGVGKAGIDVYAFDAKKQPRTVLLANFPATENRPVLFVKSFKISEGVQSVRFGFTVYDDAQVSFTAPRLFRGKLNAKELPPVVRKTIPPPTFSAAAATEFELVTAPQTDNLLYRDPTTGIMMPVGDDAENKNRSSARHRILNANTVRFELTPPAESTAKARWQSQPGAAALRAGTAWELSYRAGGVRHPRTRDAAFRLGDEVLLNTAEVMNDEKVHTVRGILQRDHAATERLFLNLEADQTPAFFELVKFSLPAIPGTHVLKSAPSPAPGYELCNLDKLYNRSYGAISAAAQTRYGKLVDAVDRDGKTGQTVQMAGVPFRWPAQSFDLIYPLDPAPSPSVHTILGTELRGGDYLPPGSNDVIEVPLSGSAREILWLMTAAMPTVLNGGAAPSVPLRLRSMDVLAVEAVYADGESEWAFPYSLADGNFVVQRFLGCYAMTVDARRPLRAFRLYNRYRNRTGLFGVAAVTLNRSAADNIPEAARNPRLYRQSIGKSQVSAAKARLEWDKHQGLLTVGNRDYTATFDLKDGFSIRAIRHLGAPEELAQHAEGGLAIRSGANYLTGKDFELEKIDISGQRAQLQLKSKVAAVPLALAVTIQGDLPDRLQLTAAIENRGDTEMSPTVQFPLLRNVQFGAPADHWLYFPRYRAILTDQECVLEAPGNERAFFVQFFDIFNPAADIGLGLLTDNRRQDILDYQLSKNADGVTAGIRHPGAWGRLAPGRGRELAPVSLIFHRGDWHTALQCYQDWVAGWFKPQRDGGLDWWRNAFLLRAELTMRPFTWNVPAYDEKQQCFRFMELMQLAHDRLGVKPDILHLSGWNTPAYYPGEAPRTGELARNYNDGEFKAENYHGGRTGQLVEALESLRQKDGIALSLYSIPAYLPKASPRGRTVGAATTTIRADGSSVQDAQCYFPCPWAWTEIYVEALAEAQRNTRAQAIYVDIFPFPRGYSCYSPNHGHEVPLNVNAAGGRLLRLLRAALPEGVAIWSEDPVMDVDMQYQNGSISYDCVPTQEHRSPLHGNDGPLPPALIPPQNIARFAFPKFKNFALFSGYDSGTPISHDFDMVFFNGLGFYDVTYGILNERARERMSKALKIEKKYADCFSSDKPSAWVETLGDYIFANRFPGRGRTLWTLYNGRFQTYRGSVLRVPHQPGMRYFDLWNGGEIVPVKVIGNQAELALVLPPQGLGCILQSAQSIE